MSKQGIIRPIDELSLKMEIKYDSVDTSMRINKSFSNASPKTIKQCNDRKRENSGIKIFKDNYRQFDLSNICSNEAIYKIKRMNLPDSKRIVEPKLIPTKEFVPTKRFNSANKVTSSGNILSLLNKTDNEESITKCRKVTNPKMYKSYNIMQEEQNAEPYKRKLADAEFKKYDHTTQIVALPGAQKRDKYSIKDDQKFLNKNNQGHILKNIRDYGSTIGCLPNSQTLVPTYAPQQKLGKHFERQNQSNELVTAYSYNSFKTSNKMEEERAFGKPSRNIKQTTSIVIKQIRHMESQITFG